jgi:HEAT repeat protein
MPGSSANAPGSTRTAGEASYKGKPTSFWTRRLAQGDEAERREAVQALLRIGPKAAEAVPALIHTLDDDETDIRESALDALARIGPAAKAAIPSLLRRLRDIDDVTYSKVVHALVEMDATDVEFARSLARDLSDPEHSGRQHAAVNALQRLGRKAKAAVPLLRERLKDKGPLTRLAVVNALQALGPDAAAALGEALKDDNQMVREAAARALWQLAPDVRGALPALQGAIKGQDQFLRHYAIITLGKMGPENLPTLLPLLKDSNPAVRYSVTEALGHMGPGAKETIPHLIDALRYSKAHESNAEARRDDAEVRRAASLALRGIGLPAVPALVELLKDKNRDDRIAAMDILANLGPQAKEVIPSLIVALNTNDPFEREQVTRTLVAIGKDALVPLLKAAQDRNIEQAHRVVGWMRAYTKESIPVLRTMLDDPDREIRRRAAEALGMLGPLAKTAVPQLVSRLKDKNPSVRHQAAQALRNIDPVAADEAEKR